VPSDRPVLGVSVIFPTPGERESLRVHSGTLASNREPRSRKKTVGIPRRWGPGTDLAAALARGLPPGAGGHDHGHDRAPAPPCAFAGAGRALGGGSDAPPPADVAGAGAAAPPPTVDTAKPTAVFRLTLAGGTRLTAELNAEHTVADLRSLVRASGGGSAPYRLLAGFPPKALDDPATTVGDANLHGASITQKLC